MKKAFSGNKADTTQVVNFTQYAEEFMEEAFIEFGKTDATLLDREKKGFSLVNYAEKNGATKEEILYCAEAACQLAPKSAKLCKRFEDAAVNCFSYGDKRQIARDNYFNGLADRIDTYPEMRDSLLGRNHHNIYTMLDQSARRTSSARTSFNYK